MTECMVRISYQKQKEGTSGRGQKFVVYTAHNGTTGEPLTVRQWAHALATHPESTSHNLTQIIIDSPFRGVFFETPGVSARTAETKPFRFCLLEAKSLALFAESKASPQAFQEHMNHSTQPFTCQFTNLGGDATLIVPRKLSSTELQQQQQQPQPDSSYSHLAAFVRNAPRNQVTALWHNVGTVYQELCWHSTEPRWLSTAGQGVPWLHFRFDRRPKYYQYRPFAQET